ncbi:hypothetical protein CGOTT_08500 [Corynebacterium gottingense]|nr:hypothetical protein CGOTT_08500 [Corynebacterium gottingense]WJZ15932.1 hypothetical protein CGOTTB_08465 [Corynebacterium gottingense]
MSMESKDTPFSGGFVLAEQDFGTIGHFDKAQLPNGLWWWSDHFVPEEQATLDSGDYLVIRGHWAVASTEGASDHSAERLLHLAQQSIDAFEDELDFICGRYVIVLHVGGTTWLYNDAIGNRTVYYSSDSAVAASHLHLLNSIAPHELISESLSDAVVADYQWAADLTPYKSLKHLLPNHKLEWEAGSSSRFYPRRPNPFLNWSAEAKYAEIERVWRAAQRQSFERYSNVAFSISGGLDSRLALAMAKPYWSQIVGYTYGLERREGSKAQRTSFYGRVMENDDSIAHQIHAACDLKNHVFIDLEALESVDFKLSELLRQNTVGFHGNRLVASYRKLFEGDWLNARGNAIELSRNGNADMAFGALASKCQADFPVDVTTRLKALGFDSQLHGYGRYKLAYWEFRHGKWLGEIHNELDAAFDTWVPGGIRRLVDLMSAFDEREVRNGLVVRDLIERNAPELNRYPVNSQKTLYQEWRDLKQEQLANDSGRSPLSAKVVNSAGKEVCDVEIRKSFRMPAAELRRGNRMLVHLHSVKVGGTLCFRVHQPYANPSAKQYMDLAVLVNGERMFSIDGAEYSGPINFSIDNLVPGDRVDLEETFLKDLPGSDSWARATRMGVSAIKFYRQKPTGERSIRHDLPK